MGWVRHFGRDHNHEENRQCLWRCTSINCIDLQWRNYSKMKTYIYENHQLWMDLLLIIKQCNVIIGRFNVEGWEIRRRVPAQLWSFSRRTEALMSRWVMVSPFSCLMCKCAKTNQSCMSYWQTNFYFGIITSIFSSSTLFLNQRGQMLWGSGEQLANVLLLSAVPNEQQVKLLYLPNMFWFLSELLFQIIRQFGLASCQMNQVPLKFYFKGTWYYEIFWLHNTRYL